jgi:hypothetical protein
MLNLREMFAAAILLAMVFAIIAIVTGHLPRHTDRQALRWPSGGRRAHWQWSVRRLGGMV